ncbi:hypothetical protein [Brevundimonas sp. FT23042]|uniref:hypothetical protein n=1 Tax=Brevundimonas sp. FT23042 TaxID=3393749 RepID=UPI003B589669
MTRLILSAAVLLGLAACDSGAPSAPPADAPATAPETSSGTGPAPSAPLVTAGPSVNVLPSTDAAIQQAAAVVKLDPLAGQGGATVKLFGTGGGDPAMNGLYVDLAFFESPAEGWRVFRIGDVLDYTVLSEAPGRVDLKVEESVMDETSGRIGSRERRLIVAWTPGADGTPPAAITVTPAQ